MWIGIAVIIYEQAAWLYLLIIFILPFFGIEKYFMSDYRALIGTEELANGMEVEEIADSEIEGEIGEMYDGPEGKIKEYIRKDLDEYLERIKIANSSEMMNKTYEHTSIVEKPRKQV